MWKLLWAWNKYWGLPLLHHPPRLSRTAAAAALLSERGLLSQTSSGGRASAHNLNLKWFSAAAVAGLPILWYYAPPFKCRKLLWMLLMEKLRDFYTLHTTTLAKLRKSLSRNRLLRFSASDTILRRPPGRVNFFLGNFSCTKMVMPWPIMKENPSCSSKILLRWKGGARARDDKEPKIIACNFDHGFSSNKECWWRQLQTARSKTSKGFAKDLCQLIVSLSRVVLFAILRHLGELHL